MKRVLQVIIISVILFLTSSRALCQRKVYFDEDSNKISETEFNKKCNANYIYKCMSYPTDSLILYKINFKHKLGKISPTHFQQIRKLLVKDGNLTINKNQTIIIKKMDSLYNYEKEMKKHKIHEKNYKKLKAENDSLGVEKHHIHKHDFNREIFEKSIEKWIKENKKCIEKFERKFNVKVVYIHQDDKSLESNFKNFNWVKDRGVIDKIFFKKNDVHDLLILKPNGDYFLSGAHFINRFIKKLLKNDNWNKFREDFQESLLTENPDGKGIFKKDKRTYHKKHCF